MKKWLLKAILPVVILIAGGAVVDHAVRTFNKPEILKEQRALLILEREKILEALGSSDEGRRNRTLCQYYNSGLFEQEKNIKVLYRLAGRNLKCRKDGYDETLEVSNLPGLTDQELKDVSHCIDQSVPITDSCTAYDKSGIFDTPRGSCSMEIAAGEGRFFAQEKVTVISEHYRRIKGVPAEAAMKPRPDQSSDAGDRTITSFSGVIRCINTTGTGKTCRSTATVQAISYPIECKKVAIHLKGITRR